MFKDSSRRWVRECKFEDSVPRVTQGNWTFKITNSSANNNQEDAHSLEDIGGFVVRAWGSRD
jgi:hypothetical protein